MYLIKSGREAALAVGIKCSKISRCLGLKVILFVINLSPKRSEICQYSLNDFIQFCSTEVCCDQNQDFLPVKLPGCF